MGRYTGKTCRLLCMLVLTASFFLVEIVVGYVTNSLALVGDSYHMLSDVIALVIGFASVRISKWRSNKNTYGWARAEVLGALINAVFLIALCFTIFVEALQRLSSDDHINNPDLMLIVGGVGLGVNIIGLALFGSHSHGGHGHSHGGGGSHGHSHGGGGKKKKSHGHSHDDDNDQLHHAVDGHSLSRTDNHSHDHSENNVKNRGTGSNNDLHSSSDQEEHFPIVDVEDVNTMKLKSSSQLNMKAVFLHVMGDALGSVIVIISALVIKYVEADWKYKLDPAMSLVLVIIILSTSIPLMRESALILLQTVPTHIQVHEIQKKLISKNPDYGNARYRNQSRWWKVEGVLAVHEFHVWQLAGNRIIASAHIRCQNLRDYMRIAEQVKLFFHNEGIHSTTIQPEFSEYEELMPEQDCVLECGPDKTCFPDTCCNAKRVGKRCEGGNCELRQRSVSTVAVNTSTHTDEPAAGVSTISQSVSYPELDTNTKL